MKAAKIIQGLHHADPLYKDKVKILSKLIQDKDGGHIIPSKLVKWADKVGIKTELNVEDKTSWWTCRI